MARWPKAIVIRGVEIPVESWEELEEIVRRYGKGPQLKDPAPGRKGDLASSSLSHSDRSLLEQFVQREDRGVLNTQIGTALGREGKGIRPELDAWSRRIGLVTQEGASAFERVQTAQGRGYRLVGVYLQAARSMLGG